MEETRTKKAMKNFSVSLICQIINFILEFYMMRMFSNKLGEKYLGIEGVFNNGLILLFSANHLGIIPAISYSLYKPFAQNDKEKILLTINFLKKSGILIGLCIVAIELCFLPWLDIIINKDIFKIQNIKLIYMLYLLDQVLPYFFVHSYSSIIYNQKKYIVSVVNFIANSCGIVAKIICLKIASNFIIYMLCSVFTTLLEYVIITYISRKMYPYLKAKTNKTLDKEIIVNTFKNAKAGLLHQSFGIIVHITDTIFISKFMGIICIGTKSAYQHIINKIRIVMWQFGESIGAGIGNLSILEDKCKVESIFNIIFFSNNWFYSLIVTILFTTFNPFIRLWMPNNHVFSSHIIIIILLNFYLIDVKKVVLLFRNNMGLYWHGRYITCCEAVINFTISYILVKKIGLAGILLGTTISILCTCFWREPYLLYKYGFKCSCLKFFKKYAVCFSLTVFCCMLANFACSKIWISGWGKVFYNILISTIIQTIIFFAAFRKQYEYLYTKKLLIQMLKDFMCKIKFIRQCRE